MTIREMREPDQSAVSALLCDCYRWLAGVEGYSAEQVEYLVVERGSLVTVRSESRDQVYLVACEGEIIVGMVAVAGNLIAKLYVAPAYHRRRAGTALLNEAEARVRAAGFDRMNLGTTPSAVGFYEARGMFVAGRKLHSAGVFCGRETVLMEKAL